MNGKDIEKVVKKFSLNDHDSRGDFSHHHKLNGLKNLDLLLL